MLARLYICIHKEYTGYNIVVIKDWEDMKG